MANEQKKPGGGPSVFATLKPYRGTVLLLSFFAVAATALNLALPKLVEHGIEDFATGSFDAVRTVSRFALVAVGILFFLYLQSVVQVEAAEMVARDLRESLVSKMSRLSYAGIQKADPSKLLTTLTADMDSVKLFVSQAVASIVSSIFTIVGAGALLLSINWKLGLAVLMVIPLVGGVFSVIFGKVRVLFLKSREVVDWLNRVINESILGAGLIRVLNSQQPEYEKFVAANTEAKNLGMKILTMFASMIPLITFCANLAMLTILALGGHFVIGGSMTLGEFAAFNSYLAMLIFPIIMIGFMGSIIAQSSASYQRMVDVLDAPEDGHTGTLTENLAGEVSLRDVSLTYGEKPALKNVSVQFRPGTRNAVIGPTAAGKTQLLSVLIGLLTPDTGSVTYGGRPIGEYDRSSLHRQVGIVFQDSVIFNATLRENIAFSSDIPEESVRRAIAAAELGDFIAALPSGIETIVSERGASLSGGQKQRVMLARALALNPKILLLDDFTARVDTATEGRILANIRAGYPGLTLISVTQKISSIEDFDQIIVLMEGEVVATGTHSHLLETCPEYVQISQSQRSTSIYEVHAE